MKLKVIPVLLVAILYLNVACASQYSKVDKDINEYDKTVEKMNIEFSKIPANPNDTNWVKLKLDTMFNIDQYLRNYTSTPFKNNYSKEEQSEFSKQMATRFSAVDGKDTSELKELLKIYDWFKISTFGMKADNQAWIIVQHADLDPEFQKQILNVLEKLWPLGETKPSNYAYLYDRVAASFSNPSKAVPQRYGTQGRCVGPGAWQPWPIEDEIHVDERRKSVGLDSMVEYAKMFKDICH